MPKIERAPRRRVESTILAEIRAWAGTQTDLILWRNNTGKLQDSTGRWVTFGLAEGSSDLVGCVTVQCWETGRSVARLLALEVKRPGQRPRPEQVAWLDVVRRAGGVAGVVTSVGEAEEIVGRARRWEL